MGYWPFHISWIGTPDQWMKEMKYFDPERWYGYTEIKRHKTLANEHASMRELHVCQFCYRNKTLHKRKRVKL
jgi:hypothetical protein